MQLREGTSVFTWDDKDVGHIARVVMNPVSKEVTHVVIRQGFLFTEDKVLPIDYIATASEDRVVLRQDVRGRGAQRALPTERSKPSGERRVLSPARTARATSA